VGLYPAVQERQYGIFFLQRQPGGSYAVTDPFHPALIASPLQVPNQQKSTDVLGSLVGELIGVLRASAATLTDPVNWRACCRATSVHRAEIAVALPWRDCFTATRAVASEWRAPDCESATKTRRYFLNSVAVL
jgi:hypothetical protein